MPPGLVRLHELYIGLPCLKWVINTVSSVVGNRCCDTCSASRQDPGLVARLWQAGHTAISVRTAHTAAASGCHEMAIPDGGSESDVKYVKVTGTSAADVKYVRILYLICVSSSSLAVFRILPCVARAPKSGVQALLIQVRSCLGIVIRLRRCLGYLCAGNATVCRVQRASDDQQRVYSHRVRDQE